MEIEYKRNLNHNYLVIVQENEEKMDSYAFQILFQNMIGEFLDCTYQALDDKIHLCYDITSKQSMKEIYTEKKLGEEELRLILSSFIKMLEHTEEFLLNSESILLKPEYIYIDVDKGKVAFCFYPVYRKSILESFRELCEYLLPKIDHEDSKAVVLGYGIYRRAAEKEFYISSIKEELYIKREEEGKKGFSEIYDEAEKEKRKEILDAFFMEEDQEEKKSWIKRLKEKFSKWKEKRKNKNENDPEREQEEQENQELKQVEEEIEKKEEYGATILLDIQPDKDKNKLLPIEPKEIPTIYLTQEVLIIGKMQEMVDIVLPFPTISRMHAKLRCREGECYIKDLNSKNGTYVNKEPIVGEEERLLKDQDEISFANILYKYCKDS